MRDAPDGSALLCVCMARSTKKHRVLERLGDYELREDPEHERPTWWRAEVSTGRYQPAWRFRARRGKPFVLEATWTFDHLPGWPITIEHELRDGVITPVRVRSEAEDGADPTILYRQLGGDALVQQTEAEMRQEFHWRLLPKEWQTAVLAKRKRGRKPATPLELALLAQEYEQAWEAEPRRPMAELARRRNESVDALRTRLDAARDGGLFEKRGPGKPGGFLTPKGRRLIEIAMEGTDHGKR